eukprot:TRINITY_DN4032_c0_g1_i1.p2 TRINITY_DN4032_c0_g1~~TRINITY_DN4032_c0_g1_i1.p2  ORF type:complete len:135 (+),score=37.01 TRINITY_DN4032_c0_g1_i1:58-462(+)
MYSTAIKEHRLRSSKAKRDLELVKEQTIRSIEVVSANLLNSINDGISRVNTNQSKLEEEAKTLQAETARFSKQTNKWLSMYKNFNTSLKELGDVKNWVQTIETDMNEVARTLESIVDLCNRDSKPKDKSSSSIQ